MSNFDIGRHGTPKQYGAGCRCAKCSAAQSAYDKRNAELRLARRVASGMVAHGTRRTYRDGCRCAGCVEANSAQSLRNYHERKR